MPKLRYERKERYSISVIHDAIKTGEDKEFDGDIIHMNSLRYVVFKRQPFCVSCGLKPQFYAKERIISVKSNPTQRYHFNLYGITKDGKEILFTKDHIIPLSKGGKNTLSNLQTMCCLCNFKKGNR